MGTVNRLVIRRRKNTMMMGTLQWDSQKPPEHTLDQAVGWTLDTVASRLRSTLSGASLFQSVSDVISDEHRRIIDCVSGKQLVSVCLIADPVTTPVEDCSVDVTFHYTLVERLFGRRHVRRNEGDLRLAISGILSSFSSHGDVQWSAGTESF